MLLWCLSEYAYVFSGRSQPLPLRTGSLFIDNFLKTSRSNFFRKIVILKPCGYSIVIPAEIQLLIKPLIRYLKRSSLLSEQGAQSFCEQWYYTNECVSQAFVSSLPLYKTQKLNSLLVFPPTWNSLQPLTVVKCPSLVLCPVLSLIYEQCYQILLRWTSFTLGVNNSEMNMMESHRFIETG